MEIDSDKDQSAVPGKDVGLLRRVFNPVLSDRRSEGQAFLPPQTSFEYMQILRSLVEEEESTQQRRRTHFMSKDFSATAPGQLFPLSWTSEVEVMKRKGEVNPFLAPTKKPCDIAPLAPVLEYGLKAVAPKFKKVTEDGVAYRIYRLGKKEVRTIQQEEARREEIAAVFELEAPVNLPKLEN